MKVGPQVLEHDADVGAVAVAEEERPGPKMR